MARIDFDATGQPPREEFTPLPDGIYSAVCTAADMVANKSGSGQHLLLKFSVFEGSREGSVVMDRLNLVNDNAQTVDIAYKVLTDLLLAMEAIRGTAKIADTGELVGHPVSIKVGTNPAKDNYGPSNKITKYLPYVAGGSTPQPVAVAAGPPAKAPWEK